MTMLGTTPEGTELDVAAREADEATSGVQAAVDASTTSADEGERSAGVPVVALATFLAVAAAGWMCAGVFRGSFARVVALGGAALGVGLVVLSYRTKRPSTVQYLSIPAAVLVGSLLVLPDAQGGSANLLSLIEEALRGGGIGNPPVPFDPGWRFLLVVFVTMLGTSAAALAIALNRPKVGIVLPGPLLFAAALVQPQGATFLSSAVALVLFVASFGVAYGADLAKDGAVSGEFEARRFGRAGGVLGLLVVALLVLSQAGFLFPEASDQQVIPPKRPQTPPAQADRVLFTMAAPGPVPIHLGVLDVYQDNAWMMPPFDAKRLEEIGPAGTLPAGSEPGETPAIPAPEEGDRLAVTFTIHDVQGHVLPSVANPVRVDRQGFALEFDPRTQDLRLPERRANKGMSYTVEGRKPPTGKDLGAALPPSPLVSEYLQAPPAPPEVQDVLVQAPDANAFDRLQYLRNFYYERVVAAGPGNPVDMPPHRVAQMLAGQEASPFEIAAGEVLLARWAGLPARLGYGYYGGESVAPGEWEVRPKHGAMWLEAYFEGHGWVPIIGTPPRAKESFSQANKNENPAVRPSEHLALVVYVPVELDRIELLYVLVRYWALRAVPWGIAAVLLLAFYPGFLKLARRYRRRRWAAGCGPTERIAVAYSELRDTAYDLNIGDPTLTPLRFLKCVAPDAEHTELAWLVTRALWGDLARDLWPEDAEAAEDMARSVVRRVRRANPMLNRIVGFGSRVSLRNPYSDEIPNLWPQWSPRRRLRAIMRRIPRLRLRRLLTRQASGTVLVLVMALVFSSCGNGGSADAGAAPALPENLVPSAAGDISFKREPQAEAAFTEAASAALVADGRVFSIHQGDVIEGSLQAAAFKPKYADRPRKVREGVLRSIGSGNFELTRLGADRVFQLRLPDQRLLAWFAPNGHYFLLMVARPGFEEAEQLMVDLLAFHRGETATATDVKRGQPVDPRRTVKN